MKFSSTWSLVFAVVLFFCNSCKQYSEKDSGVIFDENFKFKYPNAQKLNNEAIELSKSGDFKRAEVLLKEANKIEKGNPLILNNLGLIKQEQQNFEEAIKYFKSSFHLSNYKYLIASANMSLAYYRAGNSYQALKIGKFTLERKPQKSVEQLTKLTMAFAHVSINNCDSARFLLSEMDEYYVNDFQISSLRKEIDSCNFRVLRKSF